MKQAILALILAMCLGGCALFDGVSPAPKTSNFVAKQTAKTVSGKGVMMIIDAARPQRALSESFSQSLAARYAPGQSLQAIVTDLGRFGFICAPSKIPQPDPPDQVCRRLIKQIDCDHSWSVFLYDAPDSAARLARMRSLYDRICDDELLGGPA